MPDCNSFDKAVVIVMHRVPATSLIPNWKSELLFYNEYIRLGLIIVSPAEALAKKYWVH